MNIRGSSISKIYTFPPNAYLSTHTHGVTDYRFLYFLLHWIDIVRALFPLVYYYIQNKKGLTFSRYIMPEHEWRCIVDIFNRCYANIHLLHSTVPQTTVCKMYGCQLYSKHSFTLFRKQLTHYHHYADDCTAIIIQRHLHISSPNVFYSMKFFLFLMKKIPGLCPEMIQLAIRWHWLG